MNKKGQAALFWILGIFIVIGVLVFVINSGFWDSVTRGVNINTATESFGSYFGNAFVWMNYVFGGIPSWLVDMVGANSAIVITLSVFVLLLVTFGDIISVFSTFSPAVSWIAGVLLAVIAANLKAIVVILSFFIGIFSFLGGLAVLVGLGGAFAAFIGVNLGIGRFGPWIMRRRAMIVAHRAAVGSEAEGAHLGGVLRGLRELGEGFRR